MIYILRSNFPEQANWHDDFVDQLEVGLSMKLGSMNVQSIEFAATAIPNDLHYRYADDVLRNAKLSDYVFVTHYKHLDYPEVRDTKAKVIFHHHGSGANPYMHYVNRKDEIEQIRNVIDVHTFSLPTEADLILATYPEIQEFEYGTIGFPLDMERYKPYANLQKRKRIIIGKPLGPERQFYLATFLLQGLIPEYEVVFSVIEKEIDVHRKWSEFYDLQRFRDMGFQFQFNLSRDEYLRLRGESTHVFSCSLGDTISLVILEGYLCGCYPVVPKIIGGWPQFCDYISDGYVPFAKSSVESWIRNSDRLKIYVELKWFDTVQCAERLLNILGE